MRTANVPALVLAVLALCASLGAWTEARAQLRPAPATLGFSSSLGAAGSALGDDGGAMLLNPAALTHAQRRALWTAAGRYDGGESAHLGVAYPTTSGVVFGLGYARARVGAPAVGEGTRRNHVYLGTGWPATRRLSFGANVQLLSHEDDVALDTSFGLNVGAHWTSQARSARGQSPRLQAGVAIHNALEPRLRLRAEPTYPPRTLSAGLAWTAWARGRTAISAAAGIEAPRKGRRALSYVAHAHLPRGLSLAAGLHDARLRLGARASHGAWALGYTWAAASGAATHGLGVQLRFGADLETRRNAARQASELDFASRFVTLAEQRDAAYLVRRRQDADRALERGQFERAASLYRVLLETFPGDSRATRGLEHARHGALLREAATFLEQRDRSGAVRALERAVILAPDDSVSGRRLQQLRLADRDASRTRSEISRQFKDGIDAYARQDYRAAIAAFDAVLELDAQHVSATSYRDQAVNAHNVRVRSAFNQARTRLDADDLEAARAQVRRVLEMEPGHQGAGRLSTRIERAIVAKRREAERKAEQLAQVTAAQREDAAPATPVAEVQARYDTGMQLYRSGDLMRAMQTWEEVARLAPHFSEVDKYLLRVYRVTGLESYTEGRLRDAVDIWEKALQLEPENTQLRRYLNRAHAKLARAQSVDSGR